MEMDRETPATIHGVGSNARPSRVLVFRGFADHDILVL